MIKKNLQKHDDKIRRFDDVKLKCEITLRKETVL